MAALMVTDGRCQFCHRTSSDVPQLVAGDSAFICSDCVQACAALLQTRAGSAGQDEQVDRYVYQRLVRHFTPLRPQEVIATARTFPLRQQADLQRAVDDLFGERNVPENSGHVPRIWVHELEVVARTDVILPERTLQAIERNVLEFAAQREGLRGLGLSTQKGLLFHGAPGTGKTHCIRYLAGRLPGHTTLLITAEGVALLPEYMALARLLQPALVVIEDADLIARQRTERDSACDEVMLNRLLNEMDGLREHADVFFVLTTNRPDTLEPALASRPGRIDQAIEFPLPDEALRLRLIVLYAKSLPVSRALAADLARRTDGASPAFIKELLRRVAQHYLDAGANGEVSREIAEGALHEMLFSEGALNTRLLGGTGIRAS